MNRIALAYAAALGMLSVVALAAPASAAPASAAPGLLSEAEIDKTLAATAATLPRPGTPEWAARRATQKATQALTLTANKGQNKAAAAVVVCLASSEVSRVSVGGDFFMAVGEASSSCKAPVDYVSATARLFFWVPDLNRWEIAAYGNLAAEQPYPTPDKILTSVASSTCRAAYFTVLGFHQAKLGGDTATARTEGDMQQFTCG